VIIANNINKDHLPLVNEKGEDIFPNKIKNKLIIENFVTLLESIFQAMDRASRQGVFYGLDSLFFLIPIKNLQKRVKIEWFIGDVDNMFFNTNNNFFKKFLKDNSFVNDLYYFVETFVSEDYSQEYINIIKEKSKIFFN